jgi:hypothetical protein
MKHKFKIIFVVYCLFSHSSRNYVFETTFHCVELLTDCDYKTVRCSVCVYLLYVLSSVRQRQSTVSAISDTFHTIIQSMV